MRQARTIKQTNMYRKYSNRRWSNDGLRLVEFRLVTKGGVSFEELGRPGHPIGGVDRAVLKLCIKRSYWIRTREEEDWELCPSHTRHRLDRFLCCVYTPKTSFNCIQISDFIIKHYSAKRYSTVSRSLILL